MIEIDSQFPKLKYYKKGYKILDFLINLNSLSILVGFIFSFKKNGLVDIVSSLALFNFALFFVYQIFKNVIQSIENKYLCLLNLELLQENTKLRRKLNEGNL